MRTGPEGCLKLFEKLAKRKQWKEVGAFRKITNGVRLNCVCSYVYFIIKATCFVTEKEEKKSCKIINSDYRLCFVINRFFLDLYFILID